MTGGRGGLGTRRAHFGNTPPLSHIWEELLHQQTRNAIRGILHYYLGQRERIYGCKYREDMVNILV